eukprot:CAMPEP_0179952018 /NCGR_PEP_ID=MMETSP0983-20121128/24009_1 /TAXON_ID=483367 /ORGANISM="non described non described, Strain CCMP 2436" /LENGTH=72 /DNA_ID=CAMNT_0021862525 /DNA_START=446 /DNA_END=661 /DNA_ORIENTATION=+
MKSLARCLAANMLGPVQWSPSGATWRKSLDCDGISTGSLPALELALATLQRRSRASAGGPVTRGISSGSSDA